jgi:isoaspartyl peptidase/L-asparaginase-like protein (Ntn-hydrolase superfamily)
MKKMKDRVDGPGGVIAIDKKGNFGKDFNTKVMVWASIKDNTLEFGMETNEASETEYL